MARLIATRAAAKRMLHQVRDEHPALVPVFRAAMAGQIVVYTTERQDGPAPLAELDVTGKPALVILLDSTPPAAGPDGWLGLAETLAWAATTFPAGGGLPRAAYEILVQEVIVHHRFVLIETEPGLLPAGRGRWAETWSGWGPPIHTPDLVRN